jgi:putative DNA methylase
MRLAKMMRTPTREQRLIESDAFPFEFLSRLAERESWRKEIHRPIYHVHKWWAKRLGSVFRGVLLGSILPEHADLREEFYRTHQFDGVAVFDPFMGSGTTIGEAHKLGLTALGRDINPVAVEAVSTALGPMDRRKLKDALIQLSATVGKRICDLYKSIDSVGIPCDVLYYFWVMQVSCPDCTKPVDLFPSYIVAHNRHPDRKLEIQVVCPSCGVIFPCVKSGEQITCASCRYKFDMNRGTAAGVRATCSHCATEFTILPAIRKHKKRPNFRLYGKLILTRADRKEYLPATLADEQAFNECSKTLEDQQRQESFRLPDMPLEHGHNTRQAMSYGFTNWRDFFNDRQLLGLGWLRGAIDEIADESTRHAMLTLFSGVLEFNNLFASYKGEGTGAVRHMFSHHILKPERTPIEANPWGIPKSSGAFSNLFRGRLLRAIDYREGPTEIRGEKSAGRVCSPPFSGRIAESWPVIGQMGQRQIYLSCGDSAHTDLPDKSIDLVVTDPPFFDNVHYSELADFFFAWQRLDSNNGARKKASTRHESEVQDADPQKFAAKLAGVFRECHRLLKDDGLLVFSYHHSREEGWQSLAEAVLGAGFAVVNSHPVKAEMSVATPKMQAKEPIQLDIILVCRKQTLDHRLPIASLSDSFERSRAKLCRLVEEGFQLSRNDKLIVLYGQMLTSIAVASELADVASQVSVESSRPIDAKPRIRADVRQGVLFDEPE